MVRVHSGLLAQVRKSAKRRGLNSRDCEFESHPGNEIVESEQWRVEREDKNALADQWSGRRSFKAKIAGSNPAQGIRSGESREGSGKTSVSAGHWRASAPVKRSHSAVQVRFLPDTVGLVAQLAERLPLKQDDVGSSRTEAIRVVDSEEWIVDSIEVLGALGVLAVP